MPEQTESPLGPEGDPKRPRSRLELTAEDSRAISAGIKDQRLIDNPGKTLGELLSDEELYQYLQNLQNSINKFLNPEPIPRVPDSITRSLADQQVGIFRDELTASVDYLTKINRLPPEFKPKG